jgi:glycosyltransferase involved in cell wall biosynthesis
MKISYLVTCHNEVREFAFTMRQLFFHITKGGVYGDDDEIVILDDYSDDERMVKQLALYGDCLKPNVRVVQHHLDGDFGKHKTWGSRQCKGDWIVQIDADEYLSDDLLENLHELIDSNPEVEMYRVPRINEVEGLTEEDVKKWRWLVTTMNGKRVVNFPDYQCRIYKNDLRIFWQNKVHEVIVGANVTTALPPEPEWCIIHPKTIDRQRQQNALYDTMLSK